MCTPTRQRSRLRERRAGAVGIVEPVRRARLHGKYAPLRPSGGQPGEYNMGARSKDRQTDRQSDRQTEGSKATRGPTGHTRIELKPIE